MRHASPIRPSGVERLDLDRLKTPERSLAQLAGYLGAEDHRAERRRDLAPKQPGCD